MSWCAWWTRGEGKRGNYPQGLPESSEAAGGRLLHLTASRSNNCKSHFRESLPRNWSMSTGSFKAAAHFALNREQHIFLEAQLYLPVTLCNKLYLCCSFKKAVTVCFTDNKTGEIFLDMRMQTRYHSTYKIIKSVRLKLLTMTMTAAIFECSSVYHVITNSELKRGRYKHL